MSKESCELCGRELGPVTAEKHFIVPGELREQAGIRESKAVKLCPDCFRELTRWYSNNVSKIAYDENTRRFRERSPLEMVREYETAYKSFSKYKQGHRYDRVISA